MALRWLAVAGLGMACSAVELEATPVTADPADPADMLHKDRDVSALVQISARAAQLSVPSSMALRLQAITGRLFSSEDLEGAPISDEPWKNLERHSKVLGLLSNATSSLLPPVQAFYDRAFERKAVLKLTKDNLVHGPSDSSSTIPKQALLATLQPITSEWREIAAATVKALDTTGMTALRHQQDALDSISKIAAAIDAFTVNVEWFIEASKKRVPGWGALGNDMIPAQMEILKTILSEFSEKKDELVLFAQQTFDEVAAHLSQDIADPFIFIGNGTCVDSSEQPYSSFEAPGCETPLYCIQGCRMFKPTECRGMDFMSDKGCGRCMLRMETNFSTSKLPWHPGWNGGKGSGPIKSAMAPPNTTGVRCFGRQIPEWTMWPENVKKALNEDIVTMQHSFGAAARNWSSILFKLDRAFWQVESGFDLAVPEFTDNYM